MALKPTTAFPGKIAPADASYPYGKARNITAPGDGTGTPYNATLLNDVWGFFQHLLKRAGITPSEVPDTAPVSQYGDGVRKLADSRVGSFACNRWTLRTVPTASDWFDVTWSPSLSLFVAVASAGASAIMTSPDGVTWTDRTAPVGFFGYSVTWSGSLFVAVGSTGAVKVATSPDGITWTARAPTENLSNVIWAAGPGLFVAVGIDATNTFPRILTSPDGVTWTSRTVPAITSIQVAEVAWSAELSLFVAMSGFINEPLLSPDGVTWTAYPGITAAVTNDLEWSPALRLFALIGNSMLYTSPDGITWTARTFTAGNWRAIKWSPEFSLFIAVGQNRIMVSADGIAWTDRIVPQLNVWAGVAWSPERMQAVAVSSTGTNRAMTTL